MQSAETSAAQSPEAAAPLTILAVDDDALVLFGTSAMIEDLGHKPLEATSAADALALIRGGAQIDLVITDQAMPSMTGVQLAQALAQEKPGLPVVLATGYSDLPPGSPNIPMIGKPFSERDLAAKIADVLKAR
jgi:CheY-like chemotaxis protein